MGVEIRLPNITGATEREQLIQLKSYLYQLSEQLQWAFDNISTTSGTGNSGYVVNQPTRGASKGLSNAEAELTFNSLKSLIIKSADIVNAYYDEINERLEGLYVARSDFGTYAEQTSQEIEKNSTAITQTFENVQIIIQSTKDEIESTKGELVTIGQDLSYAQSDIITIKGNVETIDSSIGAIESNVSELDTTLQTTKQELQTTVQNTKTELSGTIDSAKTELNSTIEGAKSELNSAISRSVEGAKSLLDEEIEKTKTAITQNYDNLQVIISGNKNATNESLEAISENISNTRASVEETKSLLDEEIEKTNVAVERLNTKILDIKSYITSGLLYKDKNGIPVYGVEIGQFSSIDGVEEEKGFVRITAKQMTFFDSNGNEVAHISDKKLYIGEAEVTRSYKIGMFKDTVMGNGDVVTKAERGDW